MTKFIIVDSVKGGCGKTTEAIAAAVRGFKENGKKNKVCLIDMDLLGTSMEHMLVQGGFMHKEYNDDWGINPVAKYYLNDLVSKDLKEEYKSKVKIKLQEKDICNIDFVISSPKERDRGKFRVSGDSNYTLQITPTHFRGIIKKLVERLLEEKYDTVVFDMPPNSDPYTDCIFDLLLDSKYRSKKRKIKSVDAIIVSTYDRAHIYANKSWLESVCEGQDHRRKPFDSIIFLLNNNNSADKVICEDKNNAIKSNINEVVPVSYRDKVKYMYRPYIPELMEHCLFDSKIQFTDFSSVDDGWYELVEIGSLSGNLRMVV